ncbi:MAG: dienelactone hydrolase family protein [Bacteroidetes bacterium]|nr:dienelactone hydrolase family protein [Bacteroidota bacterium]
MLLISPRAHAQHACCTAHSSPSMAMFTSDPSFRNVHDVPEPYVHSAAAGSMQTVKVKGGEEATVYRVDATGASTSYVLVVHEWWGLNDHIKQEADRIAASLDHKATVIAIDLYDGKVTTTREEAAAAMGAVREERARAIIKAVIASCGPKAHIGTVGWCFGGGWSLQASLLAASQADACVIYYGMPETNVATLKTLHAPVLGIFASQDKWITPAVVESFKANMKAASKLLTVKMYDADHAFANPSNPKHDKTHAEDAYAAMIEFFRAHLVL